MGPLHHPRQPRVEPGQGVNVANLSSLRHNEQLVPEHVQVEQLLGAKGKHSSLLITLVNYAREGFYNIGPGSEWLAMDKNSEACTINILQLSYDSHRE